MLYIYQKWPMTKSDILVTWTICLTHELQCKITEIISYSALLPGLISYSAQNTWLIIVTAEKFTKLFSYCSSYITGLVSYSALSTWLDIYSDNLFDMLVIVLNLFDLLVTVHK